jgi:hypothetical protein
VFVLATSFIYIGYVLITYGCEKVSEASPPSQKNESSSDGNEFDYWEESFLFKLREEQILIKRHLKTSNSTSLFYHRMHVFIHFLLSVDICVKKPIYSNSPLVLPVFYITFSLLVTHHIHFFCNIAYIFIATFFLFPYLKALAGEVYCSNMKKKANVGDECETDLNFVTSNIASPEKIPKLLNTVGGEDLNKKRSIISICYLLYILITIYLVYAPFSVLRALGEDMSDKVCFCICFS